MFSVPEGGWSTCTVFVKYTESYNVVGAKNHFVSRQKYYSIKTAYATSKPKITMGNICHYKASGEQSKVFKKYTQVDTIWDGTKWDYANTKKEYNFKEI